MSGVEEAGYRYLTYHGMRVRVDDGVLRLYQDGVFWRRRFAKFARHTWAEAIVAGDSVRVATYEPPLLQGPPSRPEPERRGPRIPTLGQYVGGGPFSDDDLAPRQEMDS